MKTTIPKPLSAMGLITLAFCLFTGAAFGENLLIENAWVREAPPGATMLAAYGSIINPGPETVTISAAFSDQFGMVQIHRSLFKNGVASMEWQPEVVIDPGETVAFEPGGLHFMLMQPVRSLRVGDQVGIRLETEAECVFALFTVSRDAP